MKLSTQRARDLLTALSASLLTILSLAGSGLAEPTRAQAAPRNEQAPTISGTRRVGSTLTVNPGAWSGPQPIVFSYNWVRCNTQLANCRTTGRTSRTYALGSSDLGRRLVVVVTARNRDGATNAQVSSETIRARATAPRNTAPPTVSGNAREGDVLTANPGSWEGTQPMTFAYQWERCDANGGNCAGISGAAARTYAATSADVGRSVRVVVRARNDGGTRAATSAPTTAVAPGGPGGQIRLPSGKISVPIESVSLPSRLIIDGVVFSPNPVRSRSATISVRFHVVDTRGFVVRGALVYARSTPLLTTTAPETATGLDGWATLRVKPRAPRAGLVFPLRRGVNVQFYVQARRAGERLQYGVTATRLVQVRTAG